MSNIIERKSQRNNTSTTAGNLETSNTQHQIISSVQNVRSMRHEELAEEREKKERMCNIIIHGKCENKEQIEDTEFIKSMINVVGCNVKPISQ